MHRLTATLVALTLGCGEPDLVDPPDAAAANDVSYSSFDLRQMSGNNASMGDAGADDAAEPQDTRTEADTALPDLSADAGDDVTLVPGEDTDGDGLEDVWEAAFANAMLDWRRADSDGNGTPDAQEDYDADGFSNLEEYEISQWTASSGNAPDPFRRDLLVELDEMTGRTVSDAVLSEAAAVFGALQEPVGLLVYRDEAGIAAFDFDGSFGQRHTFLEGHGPTFGNSPSVLPADEMMHVAIVTRRTDDMFRGAEVVTDAQGNVERTGVLVFYDALADLHPQCGLNGNPADITLDEALASAIAHELGHALQLGHDTSVGGGINYFNIMSVPTACAEAQQRFHGEGNADATRGATDAVGASRFSVAAETLMRFNVKLSVDTATLANDGSGYSM